jgi:hypothetical protein
VTIERVDSSRILYGFYDAQCWVVFYRGLERFLLKELLFMNHYDHDRYGYISPHQIVTFMAAAYVYHPPVCSIASPYMAFSRARELWLAVETL